MLKDIYTAPCCETVGTLMSGFIATSGFDDNNNTENPGREDWDNLG